MKMSDSKVFILVAFQNAGSLGYTTLKSWGLCCFETSIFISKVFILILSTGLLTTLLAGPRRVRLSEFRVLEEADSAFHGRVFDSAQCNRFESKRIPLEAWQTQFSSLGQKKATLSEPGSLFQGKVQEVPIREKKKRVLSVWRNNHRKAVFRHRESLNTGLWAESFSRSELHTPEGRYFQQMVEAVSLQSINRFQSMRNKTDQGIPVEPITESETLPPPQVADSRSLRKGK